MWLKGVGRRARGHTGRSGIRRGWCPSCPHPRASPAALCLPPTGAHSSFRGCSESPPPSRLADRGEPCSPSITATRDEDSRGHLGPRPPHAVTPAPAPWCCPKEPTAVLVTTELAAPLSPPRPSQEASRASSGPGGTGSSVSVAQAPPRRLPGPRHCPPTGSRQSPAATAGRALTAALPL